MLLLNFLVKMLLQFQKKIGNRCAHVQTMEDQYVNNVFWILYGDDSDGSYSKLLGLLLVF
jgi:hypothetical protein